jgi:hypothetical protein
MLFLVYLTMYTVPGLLLHLSHHFLSKTFVRKNLKMNININCTKILWSYNHLKIENDLQFYLCCLHPCQCHTIVNYQLLFYHILLKGTKLNHISYHDLLLYMMHIFYTKLQTILTCSFREEDLMGSCFLPNDEIKKSL